MCIRDSYSRYPFSDIITEDTKLIKTKEMAKKMAKMNAAILITGESGKMCIRDSIISV